MFRVHYLTISKGIQIRCFKDCNTLEKAQNIKEELKNKGYLVYKDAIENL